MFQYSIGKKFRITVSDCWNSSLSSFASPLLKPVDEEKEKNIRLFLTERDGSFYINFENGFHLQEKQLNIT